jgi:hypothetical protein
MSVVLCTYLYIFLYLGWDDVIEHMRFRLELLVNEVESSSTISLYGSAALDLCDSKAEVDLLLSLPTINAKNIVHIKEKSALLIDLKNLNIPVENEKEKVCAMIMHYISRSFMSF